jgi:hypothetical protein
MAEVIALGCVWEALVWSVKPVARRPVALITHQRHHRPIAQAFGIADLLAVRSNAAPGYHHGRIAGTPSYRDGKVSGWEWLAGPGQWADFARIVLQRLG